MNYQRELEVATDLALRAGVDVWRIQRGGELGVELKQGDEPVTVADRLASEQIVAGLGTAFPSDPVISEDPDLTLPHPRAHEREFVLRPLADVAPDLALAGSTVERLLAALPPQGVRRVAASLMDA